MLISWISGLAGALLVLAILWDAFETVLVPRRIGRRIRLTRAFYMVTWAAWRWIARRAGRPGRREALLGFYGPISLLLLLVCWAAGMIAGFALLQLAAAAAAAAGPERPLGDLLYLSGETFFTLGFGDVTPASAAGRLLAVLEAGMGFGFLGTVIGYLPTIYSAFSQREIEISLLDARAGSPPTAAEFLHRAARAGLETRVEEAFRGWERWGGQILETHISYPLLAYYRSQHSNQSWLAALTVVLDSSALVLAGAGKLRVEQAQLTYAMARHALVDVTQIFVPKLPPRLPDRLPPDELERLRAHLRGTPAELPEVAEFSERLALLRAHYEPYAAALADFLLLELPPWQHPAPRRDNWRGGAWDKAMGLPKATAFWDQDHF